jgi:hypothetical protein
LHLQNVVARALRAINEGPASPASSRRLSWALVFSRRAGGAPCAAAGLARALQAPVRSAACRQCLAASGRLACRRPRCCTRGDERAHRALAPRAPVLCGRSLRRCMRRPAQAEAAASGPSGGQGTLSGWAGWARARRRRLRMDVAAADGRQRRADLAARCPFQQRRCRRRRRCWWRRGNGGGQDSPNDRF